MLSVKAFYVIKASRLGFIGEVMNWDIGLGSFFDSTDDKIIALALKQWDFHLTNEKF